jgi:hypothetical protein
MGAFEWVMVFYVIEVIALVVYELFIRKHDDDK